MTLTRTLTVAAALVIPVAAGCGSKSGSGDSIHPQAALLQEVADLLRAAGEGRPPAKAADLARFEAAFPAAYQAVKSGAVVVVWGAKMAGEGESASAPADVIAYEKKVPAEGGWVLLQNGKVKEMTADEFKAAPKAR